MQGYTKRSKGPFKLVHYCGLVDASMQFNSKGSKGLLIPVIIMA
jgi:hypothetical protein